MPPALLSGGLRTNTDRRDLSIGTRSLQGREGEVEVDQRQTKVQMTNSANCNGLELSGVELTHSNNFSVS